MNRPRKSQNAIRRKQKRAAKQARNRKFALNSEFAYSALKCALNQNIRDIESALNGGANKTITWAFQKPMPIVNRWRSEPVEKRVYELIPFQSNRRGAA